jgi:peptidoglycan LD-endopeptidase CwlK
MKIIFLILLSLSILVADDSDDESGTKLLKAYPSTIKAYQDDKIIFFDGSQLPLDDQIKDKTFEMMLKNPSLKDQMKLRYIKVVDNPTYIPQIDESPGRMRNLAFFKKMYGATEDEVKKHLVKIIWLPKTKHMTLLATSVNDVNKQLQAVSDELDTLPQNLKSYAEDISGTYCWRNVANTNRLSPHSFGIAIDIGIKRSNYWLWDKEKNNFGYKNQIPIEIVKIFEKHGFIWGGRWYQYDTMHFEYRPELLQ